MVFYGEGDEAWKRTVDYELKKMPGYRDGQDPCSPADVSRRAAHRATKKISWTWKSRI